MENKKLVIIGGGPAGLSAAIYAGRANLSPCLFEGFISGPAGGQLMTTTEVENYPGFPEGILGPELIDNLKKQAIRFGAEIRTEDILSVDLSSFHLKGNQSKVKTLAIIIATGARANRLDIPGARNGELWQKGVSACAICDGAAPVFRGRELYVVGGGDSAVEEAVFLTRYASKVFLVHRRKELRASKIMAQRAISHPKVEILWNKVMVEILGEDMVEGVVLKDVETQKREGRKAGGVFFAIGHSPMTGFLKGQVDMTDKGYLIVKPGTSQTSKAGVFAAGDVQDPFYRQAVTSAGSGCIAALDAERYLTERGHAP